MSRYVAVLAGAVSILSCANLPDLQFDECGNGVLEPNAGEACDSRVDDRLGSNLSCGAAGSAGACQYICSATSCPLGWRCGQDSICRRPSANFTLGRSGLIDALAPVLSLADLDGDEIADVVVPGEDQVQVWYSDGRGGLESRQTIATNVAGRIGYFDVNDDGVTDLAIPTGAGLQFFAGAGDQSLSPVAGSVMPSAGSARQIAYQISPGEPSGLLNVREESNIWVIDRPGGAPVRVPLGDEARAFVKNLGESTDTLFIVDAERVLVFDLQQSVRLTEVVILREPIDSRVVTGQLDFDSEVDMWVSQMGTTFIAHRRGGLFGSLVEDTRFPDGTILAAADLNADGIADAVRQDGLFLSSVTTTTTEPSYERVLQPSGFDWAEAAVGDFDKNGHMDFAVVQAQRNRVELRLQNSNGVFSPFAVGTTGPPSRLTVADFDGDGQDDIAFTARASDQTTVDVLYGGRFETRRLYAEEAELNIQVLAANTDPRHRDGLADLLISGGQRPHIFLGSRTGDMQAPFLFGETEFSSTVGAYRVGSQLVVNTEPPAQWRGPPPSDLERSDWPACLASLPPQCLLVASGPASEVFAGPAAPCTGAALVVRIENGQCDSLSVDSQLSFTDLSYDAARSLYVASGNTASQGSILILSDVQGGQLDSITFSQPILSAAAADLDSDGLPEFVALTRNGVQPRLGSDLNTVQDNLELPGLAVGDTGRLRVFDSDGDRLDDLVIGTQSRLSLYRGLTLAPEDSSP